MTLKKIYIGRYELEVIDRNKPSIYLCDVSTTEVLDNQIPYILESEHNRLVEELRKHLQIMLAASDGQLDEHRSEYGESYPESEHSINAKEYLKSIK